MACEEYARQGAKKFISSSGGNAGLAVAYAGRKLGVPVTVVVPETTPERAKKLIRREGATVKTHGPSWEEADNWAKSIDHKPIEFIHPFNDSLLWEGHATIIDEIADEMAKEGVKPGAVIVSVGGGGLLCGVVQGLRRNNLGSVPVIAVETEGAHSFSKSLKAGRLEKLPEITSIATSLGAKQVCEESLELSKQHHIESIVVSDRSAVSACIDFMADHRLIVEPACGAALAVAYEALPVLQQFEVIVIIVCGGVIATPGQLLKWLDESV